MAVNLTPQYHEAEEQYRKAKNAEERLAALRRMWIEIPKHKASEKLQAELKSKLSEARDEVEFEKTKAKKPSTSYRIPRQGAGTLVLIGGPNGGKSSLLAKFTRAKPEIAPYPFTTREPMMGMMEYLDIRIQLIDTPPITADVLEFYVSDFVRTSDATLLVVDLGDDDGPFAVEPVIERLKNVRRELVGSLPTEETDPTIHFAKTLVVANKIDAEGAGDRLEILKEILGSRFPILPVSIERGDGIDALKQTMFELLGVIRIYSKLPGKPADMTAPFTVPIGSVVTDFAEKVHQELAEKLKSARLWRAGVFEGLTVKRDQPLEDKDIVELHT